MTSSSPSTNATYPDFPHHHIPQYTSNITYGKYNIVNYLHKASKRFYCSFIASCKVSWTFRITSA